MLDALSCVNFGVLAWTSARALALSLAAVLACAAALGPMFLPAEMQRLREPRRVHIADCCWTGRRDQVVMLLRVEDRRGFGGFGDVIGVQRRFLGTSDLQIISDNLVPRAIAATPLGDRIYAVDPEGRIFAIDAASPRHRPPAVLGRHPLGGVVDMIVSLDDRQLLTRGMDGLLAWDSQAGGLLWQRPEIQATCWCLHPQAGSLLCGTVAHGLIEIELESGRTLRTLARHESRFCAVAISPDGRSAAAIAGSGAIHSLDWATGRPAHGGLGERDCRAGKTRIATFSPCGRYFAATAPHDLGTLFVWKVATGQRACELRSSSGSPLMGARFTANGVLHGWSAGGKLDWWRIAGDRPVYAASLDAASELR